MDRYESRGLRIAYDIMRDKVGSKEIEVEGVWLERCSEEESWEGNVYVLDEGFVNYEDRARVEFVSNFVYSDGRIDKRFVGGVDVISLLRWLIEYILDNGDIFDSSIGYDYYVGKKVDGRRKKIGESDEEYQERRKRLRKIRYKMRKERKKRAKEMAVRVVNDAIELYDDNVICIVGSSCDSWKWGK